MNFQLSVSHDLRSRGLSVGGTMSTDEVLIDLEGEWTFDDDTELEFASLTLTRAQVQNEAIYYRAMEDAAILLRRRLLQAWKDES